MRNMFMCKLCICMELLCFFFPFAVRDKKKTLESIHYYAKCLSHSRITISFAHIHNSTSFGRYFHVLFNFPTVKVKVTETCFKACSLAFMCMYVRMHACVRAYVCTSTNS